MVNDAASFALILLRLLATVGLFGAAVAIGWAVELWNERKMRGRDNG